jgi:hypothetical protein
VETENGMVELPYGVVATSCDYIFENYEDAKICADSLMTRKVRPQEREKGHRWVESHWLN